MKPRTKGPPTTANKGQGEGKSEVRKDISLMLQTAGDWRDFEGANEKLALAQAQAQALAKGRRLSGK